MVPAQAHIAKRFPQLGIVLFIAMLAICSVFLWALWLTGESSYDAPNLSGAALLFLGFLLAGSAPLVFEIRKETYEIGLEDIPLVCGLLLLGPLPTMATFMLATVVILSARRVSLLKIIFNLVIRALEIPVMVWIVESWSELSVESLTTVSGWTAILLAVAVADTISSVSTIIAIHLVHGQMTRKQFFIGRTVGLISSESNAIITILILVAINKSENVSLLLIPLSAILVVAYRSYSRFFRRHEALGEAYNFSKFVEGMRGLPGKEGEVLQRVRELLNARRATTWLMGVTEQTSVVITADVDGSDNTRLIENMDNSDSIRSKVFNSGDSFRVHRRNAAMDRYALETRKAEEVLIVPLRTKDSFLGFLEVHDRLGDTTTFGDDDLRVLSSLAAHFASALENQQLVERLRHQAYHDQLTDLPNRIRLIELINEAIEEAREKDELVAVALLDLNSFKDVNDALSHSYGDELLITAGQRLRDETPENATVARMGADEFAVLFSATDLVDATEQAKQFHLVLTRPYTLAGLTVEVGASVGVAGAPQHAQDGGTLLKRADVALDSAKNSGRQVAAYQPTMDQASLRRLQLVTQLREALTNGQVTVVYQPKIKLADREVVGVEALVRWNHPEFGSVYPDDFVPLAERTGLIGPLTMHVLRTALRQCKEWLERDLRIGVSVNLSVRNLVDLDFPQQVAAVLAETDAPADLLTLEITESSVMSEPDRAVPVLEALHDIGIRLSIDDFGTRYASLAYLRQLPVDEVKIDKVFVLNLATDLGDLAIVRTVVELGHTLELEVVAEGVEDELARDLLGGMNCDYAQGYLISRPLPPDRLADWVSARTVIGPSKPGVVGRTLQLTN